MNPAVKWTVIACLSAAGTLLAASPSQTQAAADQRNGIYLEQGTGAPHQLIAQTGPMETQGVGTAMATFGLRKPHMVTKLSDEKAAIRSAPTPSFLFVFGRRATPSEMMANPSLAASGMNGMPMNASVPKDFSLIRLVLTDGDRVYDSGKGQQAKFVFENIAPHVYRVHPSSPLEPGEYGFTVLQNGAAPQVWDFGVDAAR